MSRQFLIWCSHRTGSSTLYALLASMSELPDADGEPFDGTNQFSHVPRNADRDRLLAEICSRHWTIRHIFSQLPLDFNLALARAATAAGYRHIYLTRDPFARAVSRAVALQTHAWLATDETRTKLAECTGLTPIDIGQCVRQCLRVREHWQHIRPLLGPLYPVRFEQLFAGPLPARRATLYVLARFLGIAAVRWQERMSLIDQLLLRGGQNTRSVWSYIPNIDELRRALAEVAP